MEPPHILKSAAQAAARAGTIFKDNASSAGTTLHDNLLGRLAAMGLVSEKSASFGHKIEELMEVELGGGVPGRDPAAGPSVPGDRFGIALSGGGIRSATFNLGLLQSLDQRGLLERADYLSTVSGGGYIGGFRTAWHHRNPGEPFPRDRRATRDERWTEHPAFRHLREFSNFLSPRLGLFSLDTGRILAAVVTGVVPSFLAAISLIVLALLTWAALVVGLLPPGDPRTAGLRLAGLLVVLLSVTEWLWRKREARRRDLHHLHYAGAGLLSVAAAAGWHVFQLSRPWAAGATMLWLPVGESSAPGPLLLATMSPAFACLAGVVPLIGLKWLFWRRMPLVGALYHGDAEQATIDRVVSRLLMTAAGWSVVALAWTLGVMVEAGGADAIGSVLLPAAGTGGVFGWLVRLYQRSRDEGGSSRLLNRLKPRLPQILAYLTVGLLVVGLAALLVTADGTPDWSILAGMATLPATGHNLSAVVWAALTVTVLTLLFFDPNRVGLHSFYRWRLARAYLGASSDPPSEQDTRSRRRKVELSEDDDIPLDRLDAKKRPFHLVCCAANDLAGDGHIANLYRGAESAVLSPAGFSVGHHWAAWNAVPEKAWQQRLLQLRRRTGSGGVLSVPTLGQAMTASAAAFNSQMGAKSMDLGPAAGLLLAALNLRLGLWLRHPHRRHEERRRLRLPPGFAFYKELFSRTSIHDAYVHLSDGGHFENMALYELIRRRCRYIIASDCGMDPDARFNDLANLVRKVRADFGVEIDIDLGPLLRDPEGHARQHMVAGDIFYPHPDDPPGVLLLFKPSLTGDEPADILQYHSRDAAFPQQSTGDQFFDEAQWEAYRRLGRHSGDEALGFLDRTSANHTATLFARARFEALPRPPAFGETHLRVTGAVAELDTQLLGSRTPVRSQVFRELGAVAPTAPKLPPGAGAGGVERQGEDDRGTTGDGPMAQLALVRRALTFMEDTWVQADLEHWSDHPLNLGLLNYFGRWAGTPVLRLWWPVLRPLHLPSFARFMERRFGLPSTVDQSPAGADVLLLKPAELGKARYKGLVRAWTVAGPGEPETEAREARYLVYRLHLGEGTGANRADLNAALLRCRVAGQVALWPARDLFVPPGLWGAGIGADFLRRVAEADHWHELGVRVLLAAVDNSATGPDGARATADAAQLYQEAGFQAARRTRDGRNLQVDGALVPIPTVLLRPDHAGPGATGPEAAAAKRLWFVREVGGGTGEGAARA